MNDEISQTMEDLREEIRAYLTLSKSHDRAEGETKKAISTAIDAQLTRCIRRMDNLMRLVHEELMSEAKEDSDEHVNA